MTVRRSDGAVKQDAAGAPRRVLCRVLALALAPLLLTGCGGEPAKPAAPALWLVADSDTRIWLFGSVHALPRGLDWQGAAVADAVREADELMLELDPDEQSTAPDVLVRLAVARGLPPVADRVPANLVAALDRLIDDAGLPRAKLDALETWAVALLLAQSVTQDQRLSSGRGVETVLARQFAANGRPVNGLERVAGQLGLFDALPEELQRRFLAKVVADAHSAPERTAALIDAWAGGDVETLARIVDREVTALDGLREPLLTRRNAVFADWVKARLDRPGDTLMAVGAGHLVGGQSVQSVLAARGVAVRRVQ